MASNAPAIPDRNSSLNTTDSNVATVPDRNTSLNLFSVQKQKVDEKVEETKKKLRFKGSFDGKSWGREVAAQPETKYIQCVHDCPIVESSFWNRLEDLDRDMLESTLLGRKISIVSIGYEENNEEHLKAWQSTTDGAQLVKQEATLNKRLSCTIKQRELIPDPGENHTRVIRRSYVSHFIGSKLGLNSNNDRKRDDSLQKQFKQDLQSLMGRPPNSDFPDYAWCPIQREYLPVKTMKAGHLFPARCGDISMTAIFGPAEQLKWIDQKYEPGVKSELFRACNGIFWGAGAEERFGKGLFVLVFDLDSDATIDEIRTWQGSAMKEYRIRVLRPDASEMKVNFSPTSKVAWNTIDGQRVQWGDPTKPEVITFRPFLGMKMKMKMIRS
ncbi:MAG: hypothetical protein HETSPECPRED_002874 [Heterodermia speciosa]|uniref:HNH nuclease domain-containing protein n=1 Tax=Heterodermia speciosa TaxID=116794 RepID=A0A8H3PIL9_9LECA|nr:MAG: hypothetical protein HETSPECPRED_002874 [Heterodermia speciosa]